MDDTIKGFSVNGEEYQVDFETLANRPPQFGKEATEVFLPMQTDVAFQDEYVGTYFCDNISVQNCLVVGEKYVVNWDGTEYETVAVYNQGVCVIGDSFLQESGVKHEFPFLITTPSDEPWLSACTTEQGNHSFSITHKYVTRLASKYLPLYLNMDDREQRFVTESDGTSASSTTDVTIDGTSYSMYSVESGVYSPACVGFPPIDETYLVTINGVEHKAFCVYPGGNDYYLMDNWDNPSFIITLNYYGGIGNPSINFYLSTADTAVTWSVKRITHNVLPVSYAPLLMASGDSHAMTIVDALNYLSEQDGHGSPFMEYKGQS